LSAPAAGGFWEIPILYEDEHLLALDKPSRLLTSPDRYDPQRPNLMKLLHRDVARAARWARDRQLTYLANAHRLDFETSGVILLAKNKPTLIALANLFGTEKPEKIYLALVHGHPAEPAFRVDAALGPHPFKTGVVRIDARAGKHAATLFETIEEFSRFSLLRCRPLTGRTHQIRAHLQSRRLPIVGDRTYGGHPLLLSRLKPNYRLKPGRSERPLLDRAALHAQKLTLQHPQTGAIVTIEAPLPKDMVVALRYLARYGKTQVEMPSVDADAALPDDDGAGAETPAES
jgi:23S rRNA pseudouridine1911/1915/1917 synthase